ncbi:MAG: YfiR family protein [Oceanospirillaceae bacterium]|nr:YfiR family protein [Oceanospirillaceae bacterium]
MLLAFALILAIVPVSGQAASSNKKLNLIKAAFIFNIGKFVTWPDDIKAVRPTTLNICFYRKENLGRGFASINGKRIQQRRVQKHIIDSISGSSHCDILLIPPSQLSQFSTESEQLPSSPVLTIADMTGQQPNQRPYPGVTMDLVRQGKTIGFEVNLTEVRARQLAMSSELLKLARIIDPEP